MKRDSSTRLAAALLQVLRVCCIPDCCGPTSAARQPGIAVALPASDPLGDRDMNHHPLPSRAGETIAEVAFVLMLVGVWLVTCLA